MIFGWIQLGSTWSNSIDKGIIVTNDELTLEVAVLKERVEKLERIQAHHEKTTMSAFMVMADWVEAGVRQSRAAAERISETGAGVKEGPALFVTDVEASGVGNQR
jgi:hypothetical protein